MSATLTGLDVLTAGCVYSCKNNVKNIITYISVTQVALALMANVSQLQRIEKVSVYIDAHTLRLIQRQRWS